MSVFEQVARLQHRAGKVGSRWVKGKIINERDNASFRLSQQSQDILLIVLSP
jgi:hypothetical protein